MKKEIMINTIAIILIIAIVLSVAGVIRDHNQAKHKEEIVNGALVDLSLDRNDFTIIELKEFEDTNVFILRLDERLFLGAYNVGEDGIYVDVIKEI